MQIRNAIADIWADLDPQYSLPEIAAEFKNPLESLGFHLLQNNHLKLNGALHAQEIPVDVVAAKIPDVLHKHGTEYLTLDFAFKDPQGRWISSFAHYNWPENSNPNPQVKYNPALRIELVRNLIGAYPSLTAHLLFSVGAFGLRHKDLQSMLGVISADLKLNGANEILSGLQQVLTQTLQDVASYESAPTDFFAKIRTRCAATSVPVLQKFARNDRFLIIENKITSIAEADIKKSSWLEVSQETQELNTWIQRLARPFFKERAIDYLSARKQDDSYAKQLVAACVQEGKHCWPEMIQILSRQPIRPASQIEIISFIADPNWPGASLAENIIHSNFELFQESLVKSVKIARDCNDPDWVDRIRRLLGEEVDDDEP